MVVLAHYPDTSPRQPLLFEAELCSVGYNIPLRSGILEATPVGTLRKRDREKRQRVPWGDADLTPTHSMREWRGRSQRPHFLVGDGSCKAQWKTD